MRPTVVLALLLLAGGALAGTPEQEARTDALQERAARRLDDGSNDLLPAQSRLPRYSAGERPASARAALVRSDFQSVSRDAASGRISHRSPPDDDVDVLMKWDAHEMRQQAARGAHAASKSAVGGELDPAIVARVRELLRDSPEGHGDALYARAPDAPRLRQLLAISPLQQVEVGYPLSAVVKLMVTNGRFLSHCSGAMVSQMHVITAAHCVYDRDTSSFVDSVEVFPNMVDAFYPPDNPSSSSVWERIARADRAYGMAFDANIHILSGYSTAPSNPAAWDRLGWNLAGSVTIFFWAFSTSAIMFLALKMFKVLRVSEAVERDGLDTAEHGEKAYELGLLNGSGVASAAGSTNGEVMYTNPVAEIKKEAV